jgi:hypothetical protein
MTPTLDAGVCRGCGAPILWARTVYGRPIPLDPAPRADGNIVLSELDGRACYLGRNYAPKGTRYVSHFTTCPHSTTFRKPKAKKGARDERTDGAPEPGGDRPDPE